MTESARVQTAETILIERFCETAPRSAANRLETVPTREAASILEQIPVDIAAPVWDSLSPFAAAELIEAMPDESVVEILQTANTGKVAAIVSILDDAKRVELLEMLDPRLVKDIDEIMTYPPDTAGRLMDTQFLAFAEHMTVRDAQQVLKNRNLRHPVFELRILDDEQRLQSVVHLKDLALAEPHQTLGAISVHISAVVDPIATREEVIEKMESYRLDEISVIDQDGGVLGVIRHATLLDVLKEDASVDIQKMVGVSKDERATSGSWLAIRKRLPWLQVNLLTAFAAASVVGIFESTIAKFTALAVLLPVVAGQSGNAGAQALAVTMRGLALREVRVRDWPKMLRKEMFVGLWNGIAIAVVCGIGVYFWSGQPGLVLVITSSMVIAMVIAGLAGVLVPVGLKHIGQDPAVASSIVLTTVTDIAGFFSFLGIATLLSSMLS